MDDNIIYGRIPVKNALIGDIKPIRLFVKDESDELISLARKRGVAVKIVSNQELDQMTDRSNHQGACCSMPSFKYADLDETLVDVRDRTDSTIVILDGIEDPVNFGSIIRTSAAFGVDMIIIAKNHQVQVTSTVCKVATGAQTFIPIVRVANLTQTIQKLKRNGYWIVTSAGEGTDSYDEIDYSGKFALVIGSEGYGVSRLVRENSDFIASIPLVNDITALNASIACSIFLAQIASYRRHR